MRNAARCADTIDAGSAVLAGVLLGAFVRRCAGSRHADEAIGTFGQAIAALLSGPRRTDAVDAGAAILAGVFVRTFGRRCAGSSHAGFTGAAVLIVFTGLKVTVDLFVNTATSHHVAAVDGTGSSIVAIQIALASGTEVLGKDGGIYLFRELHPAIDGGTTGHFDR